MAQPIATSAQLTKHFYDRISKAYDLLSDSNEKAARDVGMAALDLQPGERVLEIGYGTGHSLVQIVTGVGPAGRVAGIDISDGMRKVAERRLDEAALGGRAELQVGDVPPLPYGDHQFDAAWMSFTLELFPLDVIPQVLAEVRRVLRPGGRLGVVCMARSQPGERDSELEKTYKWMHQHFPHIVDCQPIDAITAFRDAGFEIRSQQELKIWTMPVAALVGVSPEN